MGDGLYVGSCNGSFRRLDAKTGKVRWETNVRGAATRYFFHGDVFVAPDRIVASSDVAQAPGVEAGVHAFDRDSGRQQWKYSAGRGVLGAVVGDAAHVFAYTANGDLIALDVVSGRPVWTHPVKAPAWESPAVVGARVIAGSTDGSVQAFRSDSGHLEWRQRLAAAVSSSVRGTASDVYVGTADGALHRLAASSGVVRSSIRLDTALRPVAAPVVTRDAVLVLLADTQADYRALVSLDPALSKVRWRRPAPDKWATSRVFATQRAAWVGTPSGDVTAYCLNDGSQAWSHALANAPIRSIGGTGDLLYVGTPQGSLFAIRPPTHCM